MKTALRRVLWFVTPSCGIAALILSSVLFIEPPGLHPVAGIRNADLDELPGSDEEPWSVVVISDVQNGAAYLPELLERAKAWAPRAVVITGDLAPSPVPTLAQIPVWYFRRSPPSLPTFIVPGNHDIDRRESGSIGEREFIQWYRTTTFEFRIGRTVFLGLDNSTGPVVGADLEAARRKLEAAKNRGDRTIVCLHRNLVSFPELNLPADFDNSDLLDLIRCYDVPYVFCGHLHQDAQDQQGNTRFVAVPASGHRPANEPGQKPIAFVVVTWNGSSFELRREEFYRRNATELKGAFVYVALAKIHPLFDRFPLAMSALMGICSFVALAGSEFLYRARKGGA